MIIIKCNRSEFFVFMEPYSSGLDTGGLRVYPQPLLSPFLWGQRVVGSNPCSGSSSRICSRSTASQTLVWGGAVVSCTCTPTRTHTSPRAPEHSPRHGRLCPASAHARPGACTHPWARRPCHPHAHTRAVRRRRAPQRTCRVVLPSGESSGRCLPWCGSSAFSR